MTVDLGIGRHQVALVAGGRGVAKEKKSVAGLSGMRGPKKGVLRRAIDLILPRRFLS